MRTPSGESLTVTLSDKPIAASVRSTKSFTRSCSSITCAPSPRRSCRRRRSSTAAPPAAEPRAAADGPIMRLVMTCWPIAHRLLTVQ